LGTCGGGKGCVERKQDGTRAWNNVAWRKAVMDYALAICLLYAVGSGLVRIGTIYIREIGEVRQISSGLQAVRRENGDLRLGIKHMYTAEGKERAARWSGLVRRGERRLIVPED
jgi:hypothetical protein